MVKTVGIVSLSRGILGEPFLKHELELGVRRLEALGLNVRFGAHALMGIDFIEKHPEARAADLLDFLRDPEIDMIMTAIGGDDTYRLLPFLFDHGELQSAVSDKIFLGFSDTTINHLMLHKVGMQSFYGQAFLPDVCELSPEMLPYTRAYFEELITTGTIREIRPSPVWYNTRTDFSVSALGTEMPEHGNAGFELLQGPSVFSGKILGGCIDSLYDLFDPARYADMPALARKYGLLPEADAWRDKLLLLESSEEKPSPEKYRAALGYLKKAGILDAVRGILVGKPMDEAYDAEYRAALRETVDDETKPIVCNLSVGHAQPRCIIPFGKDAVVDVKAQKITFGG